jgi:hypothetical protein
VTVIAETPAMAASSRTPISRAARAIRHCEGVIMLTNLLTG